MFAGVPAIVVIVFLGLITIDESLWYSVFIVIPVCWYGKFQCRAGQQAIDYADGRMPYAEAVFVDLCYVPPASRSTRG